MGDYREKETVLWHPLFPITAALVGMFSEYGVSKLEDLASIILKKPKKIEPDQMKP